MMLARDSIRFAWAGVMGVIVLVVGVVVAVAIVLGLVFVLVGRAAKESQRAAESKFPDARRIEAGALFFGQQSRGVAQMRGNGTLVLTDSELSFEQWMVGRELRIPLASIQSVENPRSFLGKSQGVRLLCVGYQDDSGRADAIAWRVRDLHGWMSAVEAARAAGRSASHVVPVANAT